MLKRIVFASIAVFVAWSVLDFIIHGIILESTYQATAHLWRPMGEMKMGLMYVTTIISSICFVCIYVFLINPKSLAMGIKYGILFGLGVGIPMGYGTYSVMPVPYSLALIWSSGTLVETVVAGIITGVIIKR